MTPAFPGMPAGALAGVRVIDFTQVAAGPTCTLLLAQLGAEVLKVEAPGGDLGRKLGPPFKNGEGVAFLAMNKGKQGLVLDLKQAADVERARALLKDADVLVESFRPGVMERLGLGPDAMRALNPRLIYCSISAYGQRTAWAHKAGVDGILQAVSGLMSVTGEEGRPPSKVQAPVVDVTTGFLASTAIIAALRERDRSGAGTHLDISMFASALMLQHVSVASYLTSGDIPERCGSAAPYAAPNEAYPTADGWIMVAAYHDNRWRALCEVLDDEVMATDSRFTTLSLRVEHRTALFEQLAQHFRQHSTTFWVERLEQADIICGPVQDYSDAMDLAVALDPSLVEEDTHPIAGTVRTLVYSGFAGIAGGKLGVAPTLGKRDDGE